MQGSTPQHYTVADFLKWYDDNELVLNPKFQRGPVWSPPARSYLIDSLLRGYPIPKLLLRTTVDRDSRRTVRDVVDGQQRLRTIIDFVNNKLVLGAKSREYKGKRYSDLDGEEKDALLAYKLTCEQLINASDEDVLEVFLRINSYTVPVNEPELRNARFDNAFSDLVKDTVKLLRPVWELEVLSNRERVRMADQAVVAEIFSYFLSGVGDGGESRLTKLYEELEEAEESILPDQESMVNVCLETAQLLLEFKKEPIVARPHFLMMVASVMYAHGLLPAGKLDFDEVPAPADLLQDPDAVVEALRGVNLALSRASDGDDSVDIELVEARASTQRMKSRQTRFKHFCRALAARGDVE